MTFLFVKWMNFIHFKVLSPRICFSDRDISVNSPDGLATVIQ